MLEDLINGNLTEAKQRAKRFSLDAIYRYCQGHYAQKKAAAAAVYLKYPSQHSWNVFCNTPDSHYV